MHSDGKFAIEERTVNILNRFVKLAVVAAFVAAATGCCVLPFGRGGRGHGEYYGGDQGGGHQRQSENPSPGYGHRGPG